MDIQKAKNRIIDESQHIAKKMRALFFLRNIITDESAKILVSGFKSKSVLMKHEIAYVLGQMRLDSTIQDLIRVLDNEEEDEIVRHEAGEALGNYQYNEDIASALLRNMKCGKVPVEETCFLAYKKINENKDYMSVYHSRDPANPLEDLNFEKAKKIFLNKDECMYKRYQAMFYLRDMNTDESVDVLGEGLKDNSYLLKHEIAFVFGQMRNPRSIGVLIEKMRDENEHGMVRHECAEALGIIGTEECLQELVKYQYSKCDILRESVEVAIDLHGYINSKEVDYCEL